MHTQYTKSDTRHTMSNLPSETYNARINLLRDRMTQASIDLLLISDRENFEYFSGYRSLFWASKARPFFLVVPREGKPCVVASTSEVRAFNQTTEMVPGLYLRPYSGFTADCVAILASLMSELEPRHIAFDYGFECFGIGSLALIDVARSVSLDVKLSEAADLIWQLRMVKSTTEIEDKRTALEISTSSFREALAELRFGTTEKDFARDLTLRMIAKGASSVPWLPVRFGTKDFAYSLPPSNRALCDGDFIWVDIGAVYGTAISDVNRIAKAGNPTAEQETAYAEVRKMTIATLSAIRPGMTGAEVYGIFERLAKGSSIGLPSATASRIGHGGGINLTEPPSISPTSDEVLEEGMIIHIEPKYEIRNGVFQLEEVVVVNSNGAEFLTQTAEERLPIVKGS